MFYIKFITQAADNFHRGAQTPPTGEVCILVTVNQGLDFIACANHLKTTIAATAQSTAPAPNQMNMELDRPLLPESNSIAANPIANAPRTNATNPKKDTPIEARSINHQGTCWSGAPQFGQQGGLDSGRGAIHREQSCGVGPGDGRGAIKQRGGSYESLLRGRTNFLMR